MKRPKIYLLIPVLLILSTELRATESQHWVCESEALYRKLLTARLYGVGSDPTEGCRKLPTGVALEQLACEEPDFELCQYRWEGMESETNYWGSPIIMPATLPTAETATTAE